MSAVAAVRRSRAAILRWPRPGASLPAPPLPMPALSRRLSQSALVGLAVWAGLLFVPLGGGAGADLGAHLTLLGPLVLVPLYLDAALPASFAPSADPLLTAASWLILPGALSAAASFVVGPGALATALAAPWGAAAALVAAWGVRVAWRRLRAGTLDVPEAALAVGSVALVGGAAALAVAVPSGPLVAAYAGHGAFAVAVWAALLGRTLAGRGAGLRRAHAASAAGLAVGSGLAAVGAVAPGGAALGAAGAAVAAASAAAMGALGLAVGPSLDDRAGGLMVAASGGALAVTAALALWLAATAAADALGRYGWLSAVGFGLWGALGWRRFRPRPARAAGAGPARAGRAA